MDERPVLHVLCEVQGHTPDGRIEWTDIGEDLRIDIERIAEAQGMTVAFDSNRAFEIAEDSMSWMFRASLKGVSELKVRNFCDGRQTQDRNLCKPETDKAANYLDETEWTVPESTNQRLVA